MPKKNDTQEKGLQMSRVKTDRIACSKTVCFFFVSIFRLLMDEYVLFDKVAFRRAMCWPRRWWFSKRLQARVPASREINLETTSLIREDCVGTCAWWLLAFPYTPSCWLLLGVSWRVGTFPELTSSFGRILCSAVIFVAPGLKTLTRMILSYIFSTNGGLFPPKAAFGESRIGDAVVWSFFHRFSSNWVPKFERSPSSPFVPVALIVWFPLF